MTEQFTIYEAKTQLSELVDEAEAGEEILIARNGRPVAELVGAGDLPVHHRDPFDRMLVARARAEGRTLVTSDRQLSADDVPVLDASS